MHPSLLDALDNIDAAIFSGDTFRTKDNLLVLKEHLDRWNREYETLEKAAQIAEYDEQGWETYTSSAGESLSGIAFRQFGENGDWKVLAEQNGIENAHPTDYLPVGTVLKIKKIED